MTLAPEEFGRLRFGPFEIDVYARELWADGKRVRLQQQVFELLVCVLERPGELVGRDELSARLWLDGTFVDFEHGLNTAVRKLRRALGDSAERPRYVETVVGRGYRFLGRVEACAPGPASGRAPDSRHPLLARPPFVGRETELGALAARLPEARDGRGGVVLVAGEPGIGKTRLLEEFAERARREGALVLAGRCVQVEASSSYGPLSEALGSWVRGAGEPTLRAVVEREWSGVVAKLVPLLRERLPDVPEPAALRPDEERARLLDAVAQLFAALAKRAPTALLLDDLHWADPGTIGVLLHLAGAAKRMPLLIVGSYRDDEIDRAHPLAHLIDALGRGGSFEQLPLAGLGPDPLGAWIEAVAPGASYPALVDAVQRATDGNPFFVRELLLAWMRGEWGLGGAVGNLPIPRSVREMVAQRLSKLSEETRRLLAAASTFQGVFYFDAARQAAGLDEDLALDALDDAHTAQLVRAAGGPDDYDFVHALIRHVLYDGLAPARRVRLHRRIAEELQREAAAGAPPRSAEIADHYHRSRDLPGAEAGVEPALAAAARSESAADFTGLARLLAMALDLLRAEDPRRPRLLGRLALARVWSGAFEEAASLAREAGEAIAASEGPAAAAELLADVADAMWRGAYQPLAGAVAAQGLRYAGECRDLTWMRLASFQVLSQEAMNPELPYLPVDTPLRREVCRGLLAQRSHRPPRVMSELYVFDSRAQAIELAGEQPTALMHWIGDYHRPLAAYRERAQEASTRGELAEAALCHLTASLLESALGELGAADESAAQAEAWNRRSEPSRFRAITLRTNALIRAKIRGEGIGEAMEGLGQGVQGRSTSLASSFLASQMSAFIAEYSALLEKEEEALWALDLAMPAIEKGPSWASNYTLTIAQTVETLWTLGSERHLETIERCLREKVLDPDFRYHHTDARLSLARLCALSRRFDETSQWFARAREVLGEQGARPLRAITDFDEAWMYVRRGARGDRKRALPLLDAAVAQFQSIGMPGWVSRAEKIARS